MSPLEGLQKYLRTSDREARRGLALEVFAADVVCHDGFGDLVGDDLMNDLQAPFVDVTFLEGFMGGRGGAVVFDARDPVTDLWHRCAVVFRHRDGRIVEMFRNNQVAPPPSGKAG